MDLFQFLKGNFDYSEPILIEELNELLPIQGSTLRMKLKRLVDAGKLERYCNGIYFIPNLNSVLKEQSLSINKVIRKKYLFERNKPVGYLTGIAFANQLKLTSPIIDVYEVVTNKVASRKRITNINKWKVVLRSPRVKITEDNIKVLQVLDFLDGIENLREISLEDSKNSIQDYLNDVHIAENELIDILTNYSKSTILKANKSGVYNVLTQRDRKSTRLNSSHVSISYAVFCLKKKIHTHTYVYHSVA